MSDSAQRCNLLFAGELMPDTSQSQAQKALAEFFGVDDAPAMARFFDGRAIPLRRNLSQAEATRLYRNLRSDGLLCRIETLAPPPLPAPTPAAQRELAFGSRPAPEPERAPKPESRPRPEPRPHPRGEPTHGAVPAPKPKAEPRPKPTHGAVPASKPKAEPRPEPTHGAVPVPKPKAEPRPKQTPPLKPESGTAVKREPQASPRPRPKARPSPKSEPPRAPGSEPAPPQRPAVRVRAPGGGPAPNFFALRPATPGPEVQALRTRYGNRALLAAGAALAVAVLTAGLILRFPAAPARPMPVLLDGAAASGQLLLLTEDALLVHGRSGRGLRRIPAQDLGLSSLTTPMTATGAGSVILGGTAPGKELADLWRCELTDPRCERVTGTPLHEAVRALATNAQASALFVQLDNGELLRLENGQPVAGTALPRAPGRGRLLYDGGLLRIPAPEGSLLGVFRPDRQDFGEQLDALLLLPEPAMAAAVARILDLARVGTNYWLLLESEEGERGVFLFDGQWGARGRAELPADFAPRQLLAWRDKLLVAGAEPATLQRFSSDGEAEAPLQLTLLAEQQTQWREAQRLSGRWRSVATSTAGLLLVAALVFAALNQLLARSLTDAPRTHSAVLDPMPAGIFWLPAAREAPARLRRLGMLLVSLAVLAPLLLVYLGAGAWALAGLPAWVGSLRAIQLLQRGRGGHCGLLPDRLIAVDYDGRYCFAPRAAARGTGNLLFLGGVALPLAPPWLPNLVADGALSRELREHGAPSPAQQLARLCALNHPWARALAWLGAGWGLSAAVITTFLLAS